MLLHYCRLSSALYMSATTHCGTIHSAISIPKLLYGVEVWTPSQAETKKLEGGLSQAGRLIQGLSQRASNHVSYQLLGWDSIETMISMAKLLYVLRVLTATTYPSRRFKRNKNVSSPSTCESRIVGSLRDREVACSASDPQGSNFESCVWRTVSSQSSHHPQEVLLAQFSLYVHKGGLKPDSFHLHVKVCYSTA